MSSFAHETESTESEPETDLISSTPANIVRSVSIDIIDTNVVRTVSPLTIVTHFDSEVEDNTLNDYVYEYESESDYEYDSGTDGETDEEEEFGYCHTYCLAPRLENKVFKEENWTIRISTGKTVILKHSTYYRWCEVAAAVTKKEKARILQMSHIQFRDYNMVPVSMCDPWKYVTVLMNEDLYSDNEINEIRHLRAVPGYCVCDYVNETGIISNQDFDDDDFFPEVMEINGWLLEDTYHYIIEGGCSLDDETDEISTHI